MDKERKSNVSIDLASLVNSHDRPFVVIDKNYRIMAANKAYEKLHSTADKSPVGQKCFKVSHGKERPCSEEGEECPHEYIFNSAEAKVCSHLHCDAGHNLHQVKVSAFPLRGSNNELFLGECIEEIASVQNIESCTKQMV